MPVSAKHLKRFAFFSAVPATALKRLAANATRLTLEPNAWVFYQGDPGDAFYMLEAGAVEIFGATDETQLNLLRAGEWFGDFALLDNAPRSASVRTRAHTRLIVMSRADFLWLVTTYPIVLYVLATSSHRQLLERDRAYLAEVEARARQLEELYFTALDITRHLDRDRALEAIRARAVELLHSAGGDLFLFDVATKRLVTQSSTLPKRPNFRHGESCADIAFATGATRVGKPTRRVPRHELAAPIQLTELDGKERQLGALRVYRETNGLPYTDADGKLLELFASQAAIVIENAALIQARVLRGQLENELQNARRVQRQLIPLSPPRLRGYQVAALWHPAKEVSGDYYDFISLTDGRAAFVIADVAGKGLDAAMFMANARATLRASAAAGDDPADIIARVNVTLAQDALIGMFVTAFFGILEPSSGVFTYCNAGHNLPLVWRARARQLELLAGGNLALAIAADYSYKTSALALERGDLLLLYTDGVTEAMDARGQLFEMERLQAALCENAPDSARKVIRQIDARVRAFTGAVPQSDDITVVALRRT